MIEEVHPYTADGFLRPATAAETWGQSPEGVYKFTDVPLLKSVPIWNWGDILSFAKGMRVSGAHWGYRPREGEGARGSCTVACAVRRKRGT